MNQSQIKYTRGRAETIYRAKQQEISNKYKTPAVSAEERLEQLKRGEFSIDPSKVKYSYWYYGIIFNDENKDNDRKKEEELKALEASYRSLLDELILGDNQQALEMLKQFERM